MRSGEGGEDDECREVNNAVDKRSLTSLTTFNSFGVLF